MKSRIIPEHGKKLAVPILRRKLPMPQMGVQAITAFPEFSCNDLYVIRTDVCSAFEQIMRESADLRVLPRWATLSGDDRDIVISEYVAAFRNGHLTIGASIAPRIYEEYMCSYGISQENTTDSGVRIFRYVDDFVLFHTDERVLDEAFRNLAALLKSMGMLLSTEKTHKYRPGESFQFLGRTFRAQTQHIGQLLPPYLPELPAIRIIDDASTERNGELLINAKYLHEFFPSATLNGYLLWAALEKQTATRSPYKYNVYEGHSKIYTFYLKHIKGVYLSGGIPAKRDAMSLLIALLLHLRELAGSGALLQDFARQMGVNRDAIAEISSDARKGTPYHALVKRLFKEEYRLRTARR